MEDMKSFIARAQEMLRSETLDKAEYARMESYVLKNGSRLARTAEFASLKALLAEIAHKFDIPSIENIQEHFGANSCAQ